MTPLQFKNITLLRPKSGPVIGYHNTNLEVAQLSEALFEAVEKGLSGPELEELKIWSSSVNNQVADSSNEQNIRTLTVNATQLCNMKCTYCAAGGDGTYGDPQLRLNIGKALPQLEWLLRRCAREDRFQINFIGGEPFLYPEVIAVLAHEAQAIANPLGVELRFSVVTNGSFFTDPRVLDLLLSLKMAVTVSVDGPPEVQDRFRPLKKGSGSSSADLERGLQRLLSIKTKLPSVGLSAVFHKDYTDVMKTYQYFLQWDFDFYEFNFSHDEFDSVASKAFVESLNRVAEKADSIGGEKKLRKIKSFDTLFWRLDHQIRLQNYCGSGKSLLAMDAKGSLFACPWDINDKSLSLGDGEASVSHGLKPLQAPQVEKMDCRTCWARYLCGGGCHYTHTKARGSVLRVDPLFCDRTKGLISMTLSYFEKYRSISDEAYQNM